MSSQALFSFFLFFCNLQNEKLYEHVGAKKGIICGTARTVVIYNNIHNSPDCILRWKTHKWRKCQLVPWFLRKETPGAQETCGPGLQTRGNLDMFSSFFQYFLLIYVCFFTNSAQA